MQNGVFTREVLAREIFVLDNSRLDRATAEQEWRGEHGPVHRDYAYVIADGLVPLIQKAQAEAFEYAASCAPEYMPTNPYES